MAMKTAKLNSSQQADGISDAMPPSSSTPRVRANSHVQSMPMKDSTAASQNSWKPIVKTENHRMGPRWDSTSDSDFTRDPTM